MNQTFLTEQQLQRVAPSVFSNASSSKTSDKYSLISTIEVLKGLEQIKFFPIQARESSCRDANNKPYVKHMIRLRQENGIQVNGISPEIVLINSHNGLASYQLRAGIYRFVCCNGLIVGNDTFTHRIKHQGNVVDKVRDSAGEIIEIFPQILGKVEEWQKTPIKESHQLAYAHAAHALKWDGETTSIRASELLKPRRTSDQKDDLWTVFNNVQENLIKGGQRYIRTGESRHFTRQRTREVKSVNENTRLNTALWLLTEKLAETISA